MNHEPVNVTPDAKYERSIISNSLITLSSNLFQELSSEKVAKIAEVSASSENCFLRNKTLDLGT